MEEEYRWRRGLGRQAGQDEVCQVRTSDFLVFILEFSMPNIFPNFFPRPRYPITLLIKYSLIYLIPYSYSNQTMSIKAPLCKFRLSMGPFYNNTIFMLLEAFGRILFSINTGLRCYAS